MRRCVLTTAAAALILLVGWPASAQPTVLHYPIYSPSTARQSNCEFARASAVDGNFYAVGAPMLDTTATDAGQVFVYSATNGALLYTLNQPAPIKSLAQFGLTLALSGTRLVVGAGSPFYTTAAVFVYDLSSTNPTVPVFTLTADISANYGAAVAISGSRVVVGAPQEFVGGQPGAGSLYLYNLSRTNATTPVAHIFNPSPTNNARFGQTVAISGTRVVIGAYQQAIPR